MSEFASEGQREVEEKLRACAERLLDRSIPMSKRIEDAKETLVGIGGELHNPKMKPTSERVLRIDADDARYVQDGVLLGNRFEGCWDVTTLEIGEGVRELPSACFEGLANLRRLHLPSTLAKGEPGCYLGGETCRFLKGSLEEVVCAPGCGFIPSLQGFRALKRVVWPSGKAELGGELRVCLALESIEGLEAVTLVDSRAFDGTPLAQQGKVEFPNPEIDVYNLNVYEGLPSSMKGVRFGKTWDERAMLATVRDRKLPVATRVETWIDFTRSNFALCLLPDEERRAALENELSDMKESSQYEIVYPGYENGKDPDPQGKGSRAVFDELENDNYAAMQLKIGLTGARLTKKWISYAVKCGKYDVIRGLLTYHHPLMLEWLHAKGVSADWFLNILVCELARGGNGKKPLPVITALEGCEPGLVRRIKDRRGCNLLWELLTVEKLPWNRERCGCSPGETIACMDKIAQELIRLGADPDARNKHLGFSWNDVISVAKVKFCQ